MLYSCTHMATVGIKGLATLYSCMPACSDMIRESSNYNKYLAQTPSFTFQEHLTVFTDNITLMAETYSTYGTGSGSKLGLLRFGSGGSGWPYFARRSFARSRYCNCNMKSPTDGKFQNAGYNDGLCIMWTFGLAPEHVQRNQMLWTVDTCDCPQSMSKKLSKSDLLNPMSAFLFIQNAVCKKFVLLLILVRTHVSNYNDVVTIPHIS